MKILGENDHPSPDQTAIPSPVIYPDISFPYPTPSSEEIFRTKMFPQGLDIYPGHCPPGAFFKGYEKLTGKFKGYEKIVLRFKGYENFHTPKKN